MGALCWGEHFLHCKIPTPLSLPMIVQGGRGKKYLPSLRDVQRKEGEREMPCDGAALPPPYDKPFSPYAGICLHAYGQRVWGGHLVMEKELPHHETCVPVALHTLMQIGRERNGLPYCLPYCQHREAERGMSCDGVAIPSQSKPHSGSHSKASKLE